MTNDELQRVIDQLQRKHDEKREEERENAFSRKGHEAFGMACGLSYAIGALENYLDGE